MWMWWLVAVLLVVGVLWAVFRSGSRQERTVGESPEQILKRRYAAGEIDREEFETKLKDLRI